MPLAVEAAGGPEGADPDRARAGTGRGHGDRRHGRRDACVFLAGLYRAEQVIAERLMRLVNGKLPWPSIDPDEGAALGREADRPVACRQPGGGDPAGADVEGAGHHRRPGRRQDDHRQFDPAHPRGQRRATCSCARRLAAPPSA